MTWEVSEIGQFNGFESYDKYMCLKYCVESVFLRRNDPEKTQK